MKLSEIMETDTIYKIYDPKDNDYSEWYATVDDIIEYLEDYKEDNDDFKTDIKEEGWIKGLEELQLSFKELI